MQRHSFTLVRCYWRTPNTLYTVIRKFHGARKKKKKDANPLAGTSPSLFVSNIQWWTTDQDLEDVFGQFGDIELVIIYFS